MRTKGLYYKISSYAYLIDVRSNLPDFSFALRIPFSESNSMTILFQKDMLLFKESGTSTKPCVSSTSGMETASYFERFCLVEAKYFKSFVRIRNLIQKIPQFPKNYNLHFPPVPNTIKGPQH